MVRVLLVHWKIVGLVTALVVVGAYSSAKRTLPRYRSDASFQVGSKKYAAPRLDEPQVNELDIKTDPVLSEALVLKTQNLALAVADSLGLQLRLLEERVPAMRRKGRIGAGADADVVVFDPATLTDQATYTDSTRPSAGIRHVLVNGTFVVRDGSIVADARPGRPVRAEPR